MAILLLILLGLGTLAGALFGWIALFRINTLSRQIEQLQRELRRLRSNPGNDLEAPVSTRSVDLTAESSVAGARKTRRSPAAFPVKPVLPSQWVEALKQHWMIVLGGICLSLAGIFLARYSIEQGLFGPGARFAAGIALGLALAGAAEYLRRRHSFHPAFAALASGGSITLFAAFLAALHLYQLIGPTTAFLLLALTALITMWLALLHGPVLAAIGITGAYLVPLLLGHSSDGAAVILPYALIISTSALLVMRHVYREWLLAGVLAGGLGWVMLTLNQPMIDGFRGPYLALFAYLLMAVPGRDWQLTSPSPDGMPTGLRRLLRSGPGLTGMLPSSLLLLMLAQAWTIAAAGFSDGPIMNWLPLAAVLLLAARFKSHLRPLPWILLLLQWAALFLSFISPSADGLRVETVAPEQQAAFRLYCLASVVLYSGLALINLRARASAVWISLATITPLLFLALVFILAGDGLSTWQWSLISIMLGAAYIAIGTRLLTSPDQTRNSAWLFLAGHLAYSLAAAIFFEAASMTLALAVQIVSLSWAIRRFGMTELTWLLKFVVALVIVRLTFNPWLLTYPDQIHWSLWTGGGATLCCAIGSHFLDTRPALRRWTTGAAMHLLALTVWMELRYWLYDGNVLAGRYDFLEAALNIGLAGTLALVYHLRGRVSTQLTRLYSLYSRGLLSFALINYAFVLLATWSSSSWITESVSGTPVLNLMLLAYGVPALLGGMSTRYYETRFRPSARVFTAIAAFVFINLEIRHLWQGSLRLDQPVLSGELYTYSAVWLLMAIAAILGGAWRFGTKVYRGGLGLLIVVVAKLFLVDMSDLEGLWRVASFLGMGLGLLATAYLHQRLDPARSGT